MSEQAVEAPQAQTEGLLVRCGMCRWAYNWKGQVSFSCEVCGTSVRVLSRDTESPAALGLDDWQTPSVKGLRQGEVEGVLEGVEDYQKEKAPATDEQNPSNVFVDESRYMDPELVNAVRSRMSETDSLWYAFSDPVQPTTEPPGVIKPPPESVAPTEIEKPLVNRSPFFPGVKKEPLTEEQLGEWVNWFRSLVVDNVEQGPSPKFPHVDENGKKLKNQMIRVVMEVDTQYVFPTLTPGPIPFFEVGEMLSWMYHRIQDLENQAKVHQLHSSLLVRSYEMVQSEGSLTYEQWRQATEAYLTEQVGKRFVFVPQSEGNPYLGSWEEETVTPLTELQEQMGMSVYAPKMDPKVASIIGPMKIILTKEQQEKVKRGAKLEELGITTEQLEDAVVLEECQLLPPVKFDSNRHFVPPEEAEEMTKWLRMNKDRVEGVLVWEEEAIVALRKAQDEQYSTKDCQFNACIANYLYKMLCSHVQSQEAQGNPAHHSHVKFTRGHMEAEQLEQELADLIEVPF